MSILSEAIFASKLNKQKSSRAPGIYCSGLFPCPYRLYKSYIGEALYEEPGPTQILNMEDGWGQEEKTIVRLKKAGIVVGDRQGSVLLGRSKIPGHIDGTVVLNGEKYLWEHKAWNLRSFSSFKVHGLKDFPNVYAQVQAYMKGMGLKKAFVQVIHKDSNDYWDIVVELDDDYISEIIEWADRIKIDKWVPEPEKIPECRFCGAGCFEPALDFSSVGSASAEEMVEKWAEGKRYKDIGEMLEQEARDYFVGKKDKITGRVLVEGIIGNRELLVVDDELEIKKIIIHRFDPDKGKILAEFGPEGLMKVCTEKEITSYRFRVVS